MVALALLLFFWIVTGVLYFRGYGGRSVKLAAAWLVCAAVAWMFDLNISWLVVQAVFAVIARIMLTATEW